MATHGADIAIVGAGILGLAHAYALARRGHSVTVYERSPQAAGASVRNFGMIWPIGQPAGRMYEIALRSREVWVEVSASRAPPLFSDGFATRCLSRRRRRCCARVLRDGARTRLPVRMAEPGRSLRSQQRCAPRRPAGRHLEPDRNHSRSTRHSGAIADYFSPGGSVSSSVGARWFMTSAY